MAPGRLEWIGVPLGCYPGCSCEKFSRRAFSSYRPKRDKTKSKYYQNQSESDKDACEADVNTLIHVVIKREYAMSLKKRPLKWVVDNWRMLRSVTSPLPEQAKIAEALTHVMAERVQEILPSDEFDLKTDGNTIRIAGVGLCRGNSYNTMPRLLMSLPGTDSERLERILQIYSREIQEFVTKARRKPWPEEGSKPHVRVTLEAVDVWWGNPD